MHELPTFDYFVATQGSPFCLTLADGQSVPLELQQVSQRTAMSERHECFSLAFRLPPGLALGQGLYRIGGPCGGAWDLLLTPTLPDSQGRHYLEAVFHRDRPGAVAAPL